MRTLLCMFLLCACVMGCATDEDGGDPLFATPPIPTSEPESEPVPTPQPPPIQDLVPEPEPIIEVELEPEPVPPHDGARDLVGPKLLKGSIEPGAIDVDVELDNVTFEFDEKIEKSNLKIVGQNNLSLRWTLFIKGKEVILAKLAPRGKDLEMAKTYSIVGTVEDTHQNISKLILITFVTRAKE